MIYIYARNIYFNHQHIIYNYNIKCIMTKKTTNFHVNSSIKLVLATTLLCCAS